MLLRFVPVESKLPLDAVKPLSRRSRSGIVDCVLIFAQDLVFMLFSCSRSGVFRLSMQKLNSWMSPIPLSRDAQWRCASRFLLSGALSRFTGLEHHYVALRSSIRQKAFLQ